MCMCRCHDINQAFDQQSTSISTVEFEIKCYQNLIDLNTHEHGDGLISGSRLSSYGFRCILIISLAFCFLSSLTSGPHYVHTPIG